MVSTTRNRLPRIETLRRRIDDWRRTRRHARAPLPPRVWTAAVALVPEHGVYGTAHALGISSGALRRHLDQAPAVRQTPDTRFIELPRPVADGCVIELDGTAGRTVRVRLNGLPLADLAAFARQLAGETP